VIVGVGALMTGVAIGAMFSLAVYLQPMSTDTGWSRAGLSSAMTLDFLTMGVAGFGWGAVSDRYGTRLVVLIGAVLLGLGLVLASPAAHAENKKFWKSKAAKRNLKHLQRQKRSKSVTSDRGD
jgi:MFS family permease